MSNPEQDFEIITNNTGKTLKFFGEQIAHVSAELPSKQRWSEFNAYLTSQGEYILQGIGRSIVPGESDRHWMIMSDDPLDIVNAVVGNSASRLAKKLLATMLSGLEDCS
jgi:hypothetical protein